MTFREALAGAAGRLREADILFCDTPLLDASVLLAHAAGISRERLFASYPETVPEEVLPKFGGLLEKRLAGTPVSYIRNIKEFYGRDFYVDERVLVPRPDTETLVEKALELLEPAALMNPGGALEVLDLCTGSGCIGVTLKLERPDLGVTASDISAPALAAAALNAERLNASVSFVESSLFDRVPGRFDLIVSNPPYLTAAEMNNLARRGWPEPAAALDGGTDGLDLIRKIVESSLDYLKNNSYLLIESGPEQTETISMLMKDAGYGDVFITRDMAGRNRLTGGKKIGR